ncbi:MAG: malectin [Defluviitaleaceae bacterium]|nr:malectin [Defluviitaleaceae bacterium]
MKACLNKINARLFLFLLLAAALVLGGCGGKSGGDANPTAAPTSAPSATESPAATPVPDETNAGDADIETEDIARPVSNAKPIRINIGGPDLPEFGWISDEDIYYDNLLDTEETGYAPAFAMEQEIDISEVENPAPAEVYETARDIADVSYTFVGLEPGEFYIVRFHFSTAYVLSRITPSSIHLVIDAYVNGEQALRQYSVLKEAGGGDLRAGANKGHSVDADGIVDEYGTLKVTILKGGDWGSATAGLELIPAEFKGEINDYVSKEELRFLPGNKPEEDEPEGAESATVLPFGETEFVLADYTLEPMFEPADMPEGNKPFSVTLRIAADDLMNDALTAMGSDGYFIVGGEVEPIGVSLLKNDGEGNELLTLVSSGAGLGEDTSIKLALGENVLVIQ